MQQSYFDKNSYKKSFENTRLNQTWLKWTFADPFAKLLPTAYFNVKDDRHDFKKKAKLPHFKTEWYTI